VWCSDPDRDNRLFFFSKTSRPAVGSTQPSSRWVPGFFTGVNWQGREADRSPPSSAGVKIKYNRTPHYVYAFMAPRRTS
jgi:hypothetical protein